MLNINKSDFSVLVTALEAAGFYVPGIEDVVSGRPNTLQIIHQETVLQADLMLSGTADYDRVKFQHSRLENGLYFISPEDIVLSKLKRRKTSQSEKQWRDVLGVLKVQGEHLDLEYLRKWAVHLELSDDLALACKEAEIS